MKVRRGYWHHFGDICAYTWRSLFAHPWMLTFLFLFNVGFIFVFTMFGVPTVDKINYTAGLLVNIYTRIMLFSQSYSITDSTQLLFSEPVLQKLFLDLIWLFAILAVVTYVIYTFFQSTSVRVVGWMILDRRPFSVWSFIKLNLLWYIFYLFIRTLIFAADMVYSYVANTKSGIYGLSYLYDVLHILMFYFLFISYALLKDGNIWSTFTQSWRVGISYVHYYLPNFAVFALYQIPLIYFGFFAPALNLLSTLGYFGYAIQLAILFLAYIFIVGNTFTITHEIAQAGEYE